MRKTNKQQAIFEKFQSMMIDAVRSHTGLDGKPPGKKKARENEAILWSVNAMFYFAARKQELGGGELDSDIRALQEALEHEGRELPIIDDSGRDKFLKMVYQALRRKLQGGYPEGVPQFRKDEAILWAGNKLSRLMDDVRDLEEGGG